MARRDTPSRPSWVALFALSLSACGRCNPGQGQAPAPSASVSAALPTPTASATPSFDPEDELSTRPVELLKIRLTSGVKNREPVDELSAVHPGDRVYAHLTLRNRTGRPRKVHVAFRVNGNVRTDVDLDVAESWSFRTWAYNTILKTDKPGELTLEVTDDEGQPLADEKLPIIPPR